LGSFECYLKLLTKVNATPFDKVNAKQRQFLRFFRELASSLSKASKRQ